MAEWTLETVRTQFSDWNIQWDYGCYRAYHKDYDASYEGEEDGFVDNGMKVEARTLEDLVSELESKEEEVA